MDDAQIAVVIWIIALCAITWITLLCTFIIVVLSIFSEEKRSLYIVGTQSALRETSDGEQKQ